MVGGGNNDKNITNYDGNTIPWTGDTDHHRGLAPNSYLKVEAEPVLWYVGKTVPLNNKLQLHHLIIKLYLQKKQTCKLTVPETGT